MKKVLSLIMMAVLLLSCMTGIAALAEEDNVIQMAYCAPDQDDSQMLYVKCMRAYIDQINAENRGYTVELTVYNSDRSLETQIMQVENLMVSGCDVLFFFPCDTQGAVSILQQARDAGMTVIDATGNSEYVGTVDCVFVGSGEERCADLLDEWIQKYYDETGKQMKAGVIYGLMSQIPQLPRGDRRIDYAEAHPEQVEILVSGTGEWKTALAMSLTEDWLVAHPDMNTMFVANTDMAMGVAEGLKSSGVNLDDFIVTTVDLTWTALDMLEAGDVDVVIGCDRWDEARAAVDLCINTYLGNYTEDIYYLQDFWCVTKENSAEYREFSTAWNELIEAY